MRRLVLFLSLAMLPTICQPARAQVALCTLLPLADGELTLAGDLMSWRTSRPATIQAINVGQVNLYVSAPTSWALSPGGTPPTQFSTSGSLSGVNVGALLGGGGGVLTAVLSAIGTTTATVSLVATAASPFRSGQHVAQVTVTCSP